VRARVTRAHEGFDEKPAEGFDEKPAMAF
jgi:hypothetical protein